MTPPLVRELVSGDEIREIDVVLLDDALDETDALRIRHGVRKGLSKIPIARELHDAELLKLVRAEIPLEIIQSCFAGGKHVVDVVLVSRDVMQSNSTTRLSFRYPWARANRLRR